MSDDAFKEVEASALARLATHNARRDKLIAAYLKARTTQKKLKALAKIVRQHGEFMDQMWTCSGWISEGVLDFAEQIEKIADEL